MNKILLLLGVWLSIALISCSKKVDDNRMQAFYGGDNANFVISMPTEFSVEQGKAVMVNVAITQSSNTTLEDVALSVSGLPAGITYNVAPTIGTPSYTAQISFYASNTIALGVYPIKIIGSTGSGATKIVNANITVKAVQDCATARQGVYTVLDACNMGTYSYTATVSAPQPNTIIIYNFADLPGNVAVEATVDCSSGSVYINTQQVQGYTISGSGNFSGNQIVISYSISQGALNDYCTMTMTK